MLSRLDLVGCALFGAARAALGSFHFFLFGVVTGATGAVDLILWHQIPPGEQMPSYAVCLSSVSGTRTISAGVVGLGCGQGHVRWVRARSVIADDVIDLRNIATEPARQWAYQPSVDDPVNGFLPVIEIGPSVAVSVVSAGPVPAASSFIDRDGPEQPCDGSTVEMWDREKLRGSHASASYADGWLEPSETFTRFGGSFYFSARVAA